MKSLERYSGWGCFFASSVLILVWPLAGTIAIRNIALVLGCIASMTWLYCVRPKVTISILMPMVFLLAVPAWLWAHYFFWPTDTVAQLYDLRGTWIRVVLAVLTAFGLGQMLARHPKRMPWIVLPMCAFAFITLGGYFFNVWQNNQWLIDAFRFPFKYKSALIYFLMYPCLISYAVFHYCSKSKVYQALEKQRLSLLLAAMGVMTVCWIDFVVSVALNGILISTLMGFLLLLVYLKQDLRELKSKSLHYWLTLIVIFSILMCAITVYWKYDQKYEQKLDGLIQNINIAIQIDKYHQWQRDSRFLEAPLPNNDSGNPVNGSAYMRMAWFVKGVQLLHENPLGAGFSHLGFRHFMLIKNPYSMVAKTHSGWLDYALGLGIPGLILTWLAMILVIWQSLKSVYIQGLAHAPIALVSIWILSGIWMLWWVLEVSEREFIEHLFFIIALLGAAIKRTDAINKKIDFKLHNEII